MAASFLDKRVLVGFIVATSDGKSSTVLKVQTQSTVDEKGIQDYHYLAGNLFLVTKLADASSSAKSAMGSYSRYNFLATGWEIVSVNIATDLAPKASISSIKCIHCCQCMEPFITCCCPLGAQRRRTSSSKWPECFSGANQLNKLFWAPAVNASVFYPQLSVYSMTCSSNATAHRAFDLQSTSLSVHADSATVISAASATFPKLLQYPCNRIANHQTTFCDVDERYIQQKRSRAFMSGYTSCMPLGTISKERTVLSAASSTPIFKRIAVHQSFSALVPHITDR